MDRITVRRALLQTLARLPVAVSHTSSPPRLLVLRPDHLGDLLFMTPALHALRLAQPDAHIACMVGPWGEPILRDNPDIDELLVCDFPWFNRRAKGAPWAPYSLLWREAQRLRAHRFSAAYVMRFDFWWGAALARLAGIGQRIGYALPDVRPFLTHAVPYTAGLHEVEQNLRLVGSAPADQTVGAPDAASRPRLRFSITPADAAWAEARLRAVAPDGAVIAAHPGAGAAVKLWTTARWIDTLTALAREHCAAIVLTGGPAERPLAQAIAAGLTPPPLMLAGETTLGQLAALFARCRLVLGADSGPLHLAVAAGAATVHLFGPADPTLFGPWGDPQRNVVVQARFFDEPCHGRPCNRLDYRTDELAGHTCMQTITVDDVLAAARRAYKTTPTA